MVHCGNFLHHVSELEIIRSNALPKNASACILYTDHPIIFVSEEAQDETIRAAIAFIMHKMADKPCETSSSWRPNGGR